uniref:Zinc finger CCCH domain-containing protein 7 n=1 Tax=Ascaris suum TaxID=6253 RepID=F1KRZ5_ASCSU
MIHLVQTEPAQFSFADFVQCRCRASHHCTEECSMCSSHAEVQRDFASTSDLATEQPPLPHSHIQTSSSVIVLPPPPPPPPPTLDPPPPPSLEPPQPPPSLCSSSPQGTSYTRRTCSSQRHHDVIIGHQYDMAASSDSYYWSVVQTFYPQFFAVPDGCTTAMGVSSAPVCASKQLISTPFGTCDVPVVRAVASETLPNGASYGATDVSIESDSLYNNLIDPPPPPPIMDSASFNNENAKQPAKKNEVEYEPPEENNDEGAHCCGNGILEGECSKESRQQSPVDEVNDGWTPKCEDKASEVDEMERRRKEEAELTSRSQFKGVFYRLPKNCGRPQKSHGRTFPLKSRGESGYNDSVDFVDKESRPSPFALSPVLSHLRRNVSLEQPLLIRTATKLVRKTTSSATFAAADKPTSSGVSTTQAQKGNVVHLSQMETDPSCSVSHHNSPTSTSTQRVSHIVGDEALSIGKCPPYEPGEAEIASRKFATVNRRVLSSTVGLKRVVSNGTLSRNGMSWRRRRTNEGLEEAGVAAKDFKSAKINRRLRRINNQLFTAESNACYEFAEHGTCTAGVFCVYEHNGSDSHSKESVCAGFLSGRCHSASCGYSHKLAAHQMPICDFYRRMLCSTERCPFLHVKYTDGLKPCEKFNRGICKHGTDCGNPHRYYKAVIQKRGAPTAFDISTLQRSGSDAEEGECDTSLVEDSTLLHWNL